MTVPRLALRLALVAPLLAAAPALAGTSLVVDAASGEVLSMEDAGRAWHPASTTKMMTAYLALKAVKSGRLGLETAIPASKRAASQPRVKVYIRTGQEITLDAALRIMMVKSANDIAYVVAEGVGGDVESFVAMMNAEAARLGMRDTHFVNPNGWHHPDQQTSARDLAVLATALMREFPEYSEYWGTGALQLGRQVLHNTNGLMGRYAGINGFKTGFVCASGFNVVATATRGGRTLIAVVLGALSGAERTVKAAQLLDDGFGKWGGTGYTLESLPSGAGGRAVNICDEVRRKGGGAALADDVETEGPIAYAPSIGGNADNPLADRYGAAQPQARATGAMLTRTASGRIVLGPRAEFVPLPVAFGRTPGSASAPLAANVAGAPASQVARTAPAPALPVIAPSAPVAAGLMGAPRTLSGNGAIPASGTAFAPTKAETATEAEFSPTPLRLQGAIQPGAATSASLSPGAAAGIRPLKPAAGRPLLARPETKPETKPDLSKAKTAQVARPDAVRPAAVKPAPVKPKAQPKPASARQAAPTPPARPRAQPAPGSDT